MNDFESLGRKVAALRAERGFTQRELASRARVGLSTLARFEAGLASEFGLRKLLAVLEVLNYKLEFEQHERRRTLDDVLADRKQAR